MDSQAFENTARQLATDLITYAKSKGSQAGITDVLVSIARSNNRSVDVKNGDVVSVETGFAQRVTITLYAGQRGLSFGRNTMNAETLKSVIDENLVALPFVPEDPNIGLAKPEQLYKGADKDFDQKDPSDVSVEMLTDFAKAMEEGGRENPAIKDFRLIGVSAGAYDYFIMATNGLNLMSSNTSYSAGVQAIVENEKGMETDGFYNSATHWGDLDDPRAIGRMAADEAASKLNSTSPNTADMPIILSPEASEQFFRTFFSAIDGMAVYRGTTFLSGALGQQVMNDQITIIDDPSIMRSNTSAVCDTAGIEAKPVVFVDRGVLKSFNVNLKEARLLGIEPIGRQSGITNTIITGGSQTPEALMADIKEGIYVKDFHGGMVSTIDGTHSRQAHGLMIRNGKITEDAVSGFVVSGNLRDMFKEAVIANDTPQLPSRTTRMATPTTRLNGMKIAGK